MIGRYYVWDDLNCEESDARLIEAQGYMAAAEKYAEEDLDGLTDGPYQNPHPIRVRPEGRPSVRYYVERW